MDDFVDYRDILSGKKFDLIIADIAWNYDKSGAVKRGADAISYETVSDYAGIMGAFYIALHSHRNLWCWSDWYNVPHLLSAAQEAGFTYRALCVVKRKNFGCGAFTRKNVYYLLAWSKGKAYCNKAEAASFPEYLGEFSLHRSRKPMAVYERILRHSLPPGGVWCDPFPATHIEQVPGPQGVTLLKPRLMDISLDEAEVPT